MLPLSPEMKPARVSVVTWSPPSQSARNAGGAATPKVLLHADSAWSLVPVRQRNAVVFRGEPPPATQTSAWQLTPMRFVAVVAPIPPCECPDTPTRVLSLL